MIDPDELARLRTLNSLARGAGSAMQEAGYTSLGDAYDFTAIYCLMVLQLVEGRISIDEMLAEIGDRIRHGRHIEAPK